MNAHAHIPPTYAAQRAAFDLLISATGKWTGTADEALRDLLRSLRAHMTDTPTDEDERLLLLECIEHDAARFAAMARECGE